MSDQRWAAIQGKPETIAPDMDLIRQLLQVCAQSIQTLNNATSVTSLNGLTGAVVITAGSGVTVTESGQTITVGT